MKVTVKGCVKEGQHRLHAFIEAAKVNPDLVVYFQIEYGVPDEQAYAAQSNTLPQTSADVLTICGGDGKNGPIVKLILNRGLSVGKLSSEVLRDGERRCANGIEFVRQNLGQQRKICTAPVIAALSRAAIAQTQNRPQIARFCAILGAQDAPDNKKPWELFPQKLVHDLVESTTRNMREVLKCYQKTEFALQQFLERCDPTHLAEIRLRPQEKELFPLPGERIMNQEKGADLFMIPVVGRGRRSAEDMLKDAIKTLKLPLGSWIKYKKLKPNAKICLLLSSEKKIVAEGFVRRTAAANNGTIEIHFSKLHPVQVTPLVPAALLNLSICRSKLPDMDSLTREITTLTTGDLEFLKGEYKK